MGETFKFWTLAIEETANWDAETLARNGIRAAFGLYLIKEGEGVHLCEITPSSAALWVGNRFVMEDSRADWEDPEGLENENGGDSRFTYTRFIDVEKHDSRFLAGPIEIDPENLDGDDLDSAAWDAAAEFWGQCPDEPGILTEATYDAWQAELTAKRRAENVPPCSGRGEGTLPLFMAAAFKIFPAGVETTEGIRALRKLGWL